MQRTILDWFSLIEDRTIREQAIANYDGSVSKCKDISSAIGFGFKWYKTPPGQGRDYWDRLCENPPKLIDGWEKIKCVEWNDGEITIITYIDGTTAQVVSGLKLSTSNQPQPQYTDSFGNPIEVGEEVKVWNHNEDISCVRIFDGMYKGQFVTTLRITDAFISFKNCQKIVKKETLTIEQAQGLLKEATGKDYNITQ